MLPIQPTGFVPPASHFSVARLAQERSPESALPTDSASLQLAVPQGGPSQSSSPPLAALASPCAQQEAPPTPSLTPSRISLEEPLPVSLQSHLSAVQKALRSPETPANCYFIDDRRVQGLPWKELRTADAFTMSLKGAQAEDALVASGYALARGIPSMYVVPERKALPWFLQEADQSYPGLVTIVEGDRATSVEEKGAEALQGIRAQALPSFPLKQAQVQSFLGCLMSGLSKEQYAEGRSHLLAIHDALGSYRGDTSNYCEGINVGSVESFDKPKNSLCIDLEAVRRAENCVFYAYDSKSRPSGMWVELGAALAWDKPCTLLVPDKSCLPPALREGALPENLKVIEFGTHAQFLESLKDPQQALARLGGSR